MIEPDLLFYLWGTDTCFVNKGTLKQLTYRAEHTEISLGDEYVVSVRNNTPGTVHFAVNSLPSGDLLMAIEMPVPCAADFKKFAENLVRTLHG